MKIRINNKIVDESTIEFDGIDTNDYPDFCDAYISKARFEDGTELNDVQLEYLQDTLHWELNEMILEYIQ